MTKKIFEPLHIALFAVFIAFCFIIFHRGSPNVQATQSGSATATTTLSAASSTAASSASKSGGETYYNATLGFSFDNPHPSTWVMTTNNKDGSLVSFGPRTPQIGVGLKVYYWPGSSEFEPSVKIATIADLKNAVMAKYKNVEFASISTISAGGFSMVVVKGLTVAFTTSDAYFALLPTGTLNFGGTGSLSGFIHRI